MKKDSASIVFGMSYRRGIFVRKKLTFDSCVFLGIFVENVIRTRLNNNNLISVVSDRFCGTQFSRIVTATKKQNNLFALCSKYSQV